MFRSDLNPEERLYEEIKRGGVTRTFWGALGVALLAHYGVFLLWSRYSHGDQSIPFVPNHMFLVQIVSSAPGEVVIPVRVSASEPVKPQKNYSANIDVAAVKEIEPQKLESIKEAVMDDLKRSLARSSRMEKPTAPRGGTIFDPRLRKKLSQERTSLHNDEFGGESIETLITNTGDKIIVNNGRCLRVATQGLDRMYYPVNCGFIKTKQEKFSHTFQQALRVRGLK